MSRFVSRDQTDGQRIRQTDRRTGRSTDRQTDMMKLVIAFSKFANAPMTYLQCKNRRTILKFSNLKHI